MMTVLGKHLDFNKVKVNPLTLLFNCFKEFWSCLFLSYTKVYDYPQSPTTIHNHPQPCTTTQNHPQPPTTTHSHPQPSASTHNYSQPPTTTHNHPQPSITIHNHPQPSTTTQKLPKKAKTCHKQLCYCTLDVNTETDVGFDSDMKQWYIYMCVRVCVYILYNSLYLLFFGQLIACFCQHYK